MAAELAIMAGRIGALLERVRRDGAEPATWSEVEELLTDGYACVHRLEAERSRIIRRIPSLDSEIGELRCLLAELRDHGTALRGSPKPLESEQEERA
jgi:hypothetical protein